MKFGVQTLLLFALNIFSTSAKDYEEPLVCPTPGELRTVQIGIPGSGSFLAVEWEIELYGQVYDMCVYFARKFGGGGQYMVKTPLLPGKVWTDEEKGALEAMGTFFKVGQGDGPPLRYWYFLQYHGGVPANRLHDWTALVDPGASADEATQDECISFMGQIREATAKAALRKTIHKENWLLSGRIDFENILLAKGTDGSYQAQLTDWKFYGTYFSPTEHAYKVAFEFARDGAKRAFSDSLCY